ncbi:hypothetical protein [Aeromonas veronii]|uniref:hypothetical protein n=1 Tax=Aeromonas veronii TaxID=654 RepID=UPI003BA37B8D
MWEDDEDDSCYSLSFSFKNSAQIKSERIAEMSKKAPSQLRAEDIFDVIDAGLELQVFIPVALGLIEKNSHISFEDPYQDEFSILDAHAKYFSKNPTQKKKYEKLKLWQKNRGNCISPKTGRVRKSYSNETFAIAEARYMADSYGEQVPIQCDFCGEWHLTPASYHTPSKTCEYCTDGDGNSKQLYFSKEGAIKRARIIANDRGLNLDVYRCPHENGWHLTKS